MSEADREYARRVLLESFTAGWQAALAVRITNPRVLAVVESCFDMWLAEALDEADVLGLTFRGREDLPSLSHGPRPLGSPHGTETRRVPAGSSGPRPSGRRQDVAPVPPIPGQRAPLDDVGRPSEPPATVGRDLRRMLNLPPRIKGPKHRDVPAGRD